MPCHSAASGLHGLAAVWYDAAVNAADANDRDLHLALDDEALLAACDMQTYRASGPGGQHRNKVSSAVRLRHGPTGLSAQAEESRSQHENRRRALRRLRMHLATRLRKPAPPAGAPLPTMLAGCLRAGPRRGGGARRRLEVGPKDRRFWPVAALLLDRLDHHQGRVAPAAGELGIATSNLVAFLRSERHLLAAAQQMRRDHGQKPLR